MEYQWTITSPEERDMVREAIYRLLKPFAPAEQLDVLAYLASWAGIERSECADDRAMTSSELIQLAREELVDVGVHTINHCPNDKRESDWIVIQHFARWRCDVEALLCPDGMEPTAILCRSLMALGKYT